MASYFERGSASNVETNSESSIEITGENTVEATDEVDAIDFENYDSNNEVPPRDEFELLKAGDVAINQRLEAQADDYRDKGLSEEQIKEKIVADKWRFQQEFLQDAFPGQEVSPNVFNGFLENGAKDRIKEAGNSVELREAMLETSENGEKSKEIEEIEFVDFENYEIDVEETEEEKSDETIEGSEEIEYLDFENYDRDIEEDEEPQDEIGAEIEETNVQYEGLDNLPLERSAEIREAIDEMSEEYPELKDIPIHIEVTDDLNPGTFAAAAPLVVDNHFEAIVKINRQEFDETLCDRLKEYEQKGFFAANGSKAVVKHELGHILQLKLDATSVELEPGESVEDVRNREKFNEMIGKWNSNEHTDRILSQALYNLSLCSRDVSRELSMYAATNSAEALAEAISEVSTSEHPRRLAVEIVREYHKLKEELEETIC